MRHSEGHPVVAAVIDLVMAPLARLRPGVIGQAGGQVLELGAGTGLNLRHYHDDVDLHAVEPDPHMLRRARQRAQGLPFPVELIEVGA